VSRNNAVSSESSALERSQAGAQLLAQAVQGDREVADLAGSGQ